MSVFDTTGNLETEVHKIPSGDKIQHPEAVTIDPFGNIILTDGLLGTMLFSSDAEFIDMLKLDLTPKKMMFHSGKLFVLFDVETGENDVDSFINVYKYSI